MIRVYQVKCDRADSKELVRKLCKKLQIQEKDLLSWSIHRRSVDARHQKVLFSYIVDCAIRNEKKALKLVDVRLCPDEHYVFPEKGKDPLSHRPVVVGFGPAGMFSALLLAQAGYCPIILERGSEIETRTQKVEHFWKNGELDPESNVQFGQGGAGAFSDGKLTTRSKDKRARKILEELVKWGAKKEILIDAHPHIGTDAFRPILKECQKEIESLGGTFYFDTCLQDIEIKAEGILLKTQNKTFMSNVMILAIGHSASDTIRMLHHHGIQMENKPFAIGVRIEHDQKWVNKAMLKDCANEPDLIPARYQVTAKTSQGKGVYSFCMCPGGYVIPSSAQPGQLVINGMSYASRGGTNANSALLVQVDESDYGEELFAGLDYQEKLEKKAFQMAKGYKACVQMASDYLNNRVSSHLGSVSLTYALGGSFVDLNDLFSDPVNKALHEALSIFEEKIPGFVSADAVLSAVESRSSSSVRFVRKEDLETTIQGIYACGEGSGYAGGIMTSAIDGLKCAESIIGKYTNAMIQYKKEKRSGK